MIKLDLFDPRSLEQVKRFSKSAQEIKFAPVRQRLFARLQKAAKRKLSDLDVIVQGPVDLILLSDIRDTISQVEPKMGTGTALATVLSWFENRCVGYSLIKEAISVTEAKYVANVMTEDNIKDTQFYQTLISYTNATMKVTEWSNMTELQQDFLRQEFLATGPAWNATTTLANKSNDFRTWLTGVRGITSLTASADWPAKYSESGISDSKRIWETVKDVLGNVEITQTTSSDQSALSFMARLQALRFDDLAKGNVSTVIELYESLVKTSNRGKGLPLEAAQRKAFIKDLYQVHATLCSMFSKAKAASMLNDMLAVIALMYAFLYYLELKTIDGVLPRIVRMVASTAWATSLKAWASKIASWYLHFTKIPMSILYQETVLCNDEIESIMAKSYLTDLELKTLQEHKDKLAEDASKVLLSNFMNVVKDEYANYKVAVAADYLLPNSLMEAMWPNHVNPLPKADPNNLPAMFRYQFNSSLTSRIFPVTRPRCYNALSEVIQDAQSAIIMFRNLMEYLQLNYDGYPVIANEIEIPDDGKTFKPISTPMYWDFRKQNPYTSITQKYVVDFTKATYPDRYPLKTVNDGNYFKPMWRRDYKKPMINTEGHPLYYLRDLELPRYYEQFRELYSIPVPYAYTATASKECIKATFTTASEMMMNSAYGWSDEDKFIKAAKIMTSSNSTKAQAVADILGGVMFAYVAPVDGKESAYATITPALSKSELAAFVANGTFPVGPKLSGDVFVSSDKTLRVNFWDMMTIIDQSTVGIDELNSLPWRVVLPTMPAIYGHPTSELIALNKPNNFTVEMLNDRFRLYRVANFEGKEYYVLFLLHSVVPLMETSEKGMWDTPDLGLAVDILDTTFNANYGVLSQYSDMFAKDLLSAYNTSAPNIVNTTKLAVWATQIAGNKTLTYKMIKNPAMGATFAERAMNIANAASAANAAGKALWAVVDYFYKSSTIVFPHARFRPQEVDPLVDTLWRNQFTKKMLREDEYDLIETAEVTHDELIQLDRSDYQETWASADAPLMNGEVSESTYQLKFSVERPTEPSLPGDDEKAPINSMTPQGSQFAPAPSEMMDQATIHPINKGQGGVTMQVPSAANDGSPKVADPVDKSTVIDTSGHTAAGAPVPATGEPAVEENTPGIPVASEAPVDKVNEEAKSRADESGIARKPNDKKKRQGKKPKEEPDADADANNQ